MPVVGMGGLFFRAKDPDALNAWYREHLNVGGGCSGTDEASVNQWVWNTAGGPMVFAPFAADTDYFSAEKQHMINLRVTDLDSLLEQLNAAGIAIITKPEWDSPETGKFARIYDPEGNAIELWGSADSVIPVWIGAAAAIVLLGLIVMIGARGRPEDLGARKARRSSNDGGSGSTLDGSAGSGVSCSADTGGGNCGGGDGGGGGD